jgi:hypothetical protein
LDTSQASAQLDAEVLGIAVSAALLGRWAAWFAPDPQPFLAPAGGALARLGNDFQPRSAPELRDTFEIYSVPDGMVCRSIAAADFAALPRETRAELVRFQHTAGRSLVPSVRAWPALKTATQADGHRFVWWPELLAGREREIILVAYLANSHRPSRHTEVAEPGWQATSGLLPGARALAGTFPPGSGPNCFGTVMGAAGVPGAAEVWMQRKPFEAWLAEATRPGGRDDEPGTVLVWRSAAGLVQHTAVTLGEGWALHKPSQGWMSPVKVLTVADAKSSSRLVGRRLSRRALI